MVKIFYYHVFVDDYGLTIDLETDLGLITILTGFPRCNKWITLNLICALEIKPGINIEHLEKPIDLHVRDIQTFLHQALMKIKEDVLYGKDEVTKRVISNYRRKNYDTI